MQPDTAPRRKIGRPLVHASHAARQAAYRRRHNRVTVKLDADLMQALENYIEDSGAILSKGKALEILLREELGV